MQIFTTYGARNRLVDKGRNSKIGISRADLFVLLKGVIEREDELRYSSLCSFNLLLLVEEVE